MKKRKILALILSITMLIQMWLPVTTVAALSIKEEVCKHHSTHSEECGYIEAASCTHEHSEECYTQTLNCTLEEGEVVADSEQPHAHDEGCYKEEEACKHAHDQTCGYTDGVACSFDPTKCPECIKENENNNEGESKTTEISEFANLEDIVKYQSVALNTEETSINLPQTLEASTAQGEETVSVLTWSAYNVTDEGNAKEKTKYDSSIPGATYIFIPTLAEGYTLSEGVSLPEINVMVGAIAQTMAEGFSIDIGTASQYIEITDTGYKVGNQTTETSYTGPYILYSTAGTATGTNATKNHIAVNNSGTTPIDITLKNVNIAILYIDRCAFAIEKGAVNLTLEGNSSLKSGEYKAGLRVSSTAQLTITDKSTGSLTAKGGEVGGAGIGGNISETSGIINIKGGTVTAAGGAPLSGIGGAVGAGIGGGSGAPCGTINISGGTVTAIGTADADRYYGSAGIGSGYSGDSGVAGGTINISGGTVTATGGKGAAGIGGAAGMGSGSGGNITITGGNVKANGGFRTAAIGGGERGSGGTIVISGGVVEAVGSYEAASIGGGYSGSNGSFSTGISGTAVIFANRGIADQTNEAKWSGIIASGSGSRLYGSNDYTFTENVTIPSYYKIYLTRGQTLTVADGITLTVNGNIYTYGGKVITTGSGKIVNPENIWGSALIDVSGSQTVEISSHGGDSCYGHYITGKTKENKVLVNGGKHDITIKDLSIDNACAFEIKGGAQVNLTLVGNNTLISEDYKAGLQVSSESGLTITEKDIGILTAQGGLGAAGIGGAYVRGTSGATGTIIIDGGRIYAKGGEEGAGIGSGPDSSGNVMNSSSKVIINGGSITATGGRDGAGIGGGRDGTGGTITINGGTVNATGGNGAGIGGGGETSDSDRNEAASGFITINGGTIYATGGEGAAIGSGRSGSGQRIVITGGTVTATTKNTEHRIEGGAGIGSGRCTNTASTNSGDIIISGGVINATGTYGGAGIGGGNRSDSKNITITGGIVTASGTPYGVIDSDNSGPGIGSGYGNNAEKITINGDAVVFATAGDPSSDHIGAGYGGTVKEVNRTRGIIFEGNSGVLYGDNVTLPGNVTLSSNKDLTIHSGKTLTVPENITLSNNGALFVNAGNITGAGKINGSGKFIATMLLEDIAPIPDQAYTGKEIKPTVTVNSTRKILGQDFDIMSYVFSTRYENNINVGEAKAVFAYSGTSFEKPFQIVKSGTVFDGGVKIYNQNVETTRFTYGDTITVKVKPKATGVAATRNAPAANQMAMYVGSTQLCEPVNADSNGMYTMTYDTTRKLLEPREDYSYPIDVKYVGNANMADYSASETITLSKKELIATPASNASKPYDGNKSFRNVALTLNGIEAGDDSLTATADGTSASANAGTSAFTATTITLSGANAAYYTLAPTAVSGNIKITVATPTLSLTAEKKKVSSRATIGSHDDTVVLTATTSGVNVEKPDGSVTFKHGDRELATINTKNGVAIYEWENPPVGENTVTANFTASSGNYSGTQVTASCNFGIDKVAQKNFKISEITEKTYGDKAFSLSTTGGNGAGAVSFSVPSNNGVLTINGNTATIVGVGTVTITAIKEGDNNYNEATTTASIEIAPKPVTVTIVKPISKIYDKSINAQVTYIVNGKANELDKVTASGIATFDNANAGENKVITANNINLSGADKNKYILNKDATASTTANIAKKPLLWKTSGTVKEKVYDGTINGQVEKNPTLDGVIATDEVKVKEGTLAFENANVGSNKSVTASGFGIEGKDADNYIAPVSQPIFESGTINGKDTTPTVTISGKYTFTGTQIRPTAAEIVVTDGKNIIPSSNYTLSYGDNVNAGNGAGSVKITLKGNYSGSVTQTFNIEKATTNDKVIPEPILMTAKEENAYSIPLPTVLANAGEMTYVITTVSNEDIFSKQPNISIDGKKWNLQVTLAHKKMKHQR